MRVWFSTRWFRISEVCRPRTSFRRPASRKVNMNARLSAPALMEESFRWFGPNDSVPLSFIRQTGATAVFTSLHQIPYGELWPREAIRERKQMIEAAGLRWTAVESVPVHEDIR